MRVSSKTSLKKWKKIAWLIRRAGYTAHDYAQSIKHNLENGGTASARGNAQRVFSSLSEDLYSLHYALFGKSLKTEWLDTVNINNLEEVWKLLWDLNQKLENVARELFHDIGAERFYGLVCGAEQGYYVLRTGVEKLYTLLTGEEPAK